jgi:O-antigen biosynthesis protein
LKITIIYEKNLRPDTTGIYCEKALRELGHTVKHVAPSVLKKHKTDLYLFIDDGLNYVPSKDLTPSAYWAIDTHLRYDNELARGRAAQHTFVAQKQDVERLRNDGVENVSWLPLACDPDIHKAKQTEKVYDIAFVGNVYMTPEYKERVHVLHEVFKKFPNFFYGKVPYTEMADMYGKAKLGINKSVSYDMNMRVFEVMCSGTLLITNYLDDIIELFGDMVPLYKNTKQALGLIEYYLRADSARERHAQACQDEVIEHHTYKHRMKQLIKENDNG